MIKRKIKFLFIIICFFSNNAFANISLIRDSEIEDFVSQIVNPLLKVADLDPDNVSIHIVDDNSINAFVAGGQNIFINTGLITKFDNPDALIGVIAHEIGHIKAGHLARFNEGIDSAKKALMLSYLLGVGAIASGSYDGGSAMIMGGSHIANRINQKYTRNQEEVADQYALKFLDKISYSAKGLIELLQSLAQEFKPYSKIIDEYSLSHPISQKRIDLIKERTRGKNNNNKELSQYLQARMNVVTAKIKGFTGKAEILLDNYGNNKTKIAQYILAIAYHRHGDSKKSLAIIDNIIQDNKSSSSLFILGFLYELKAQILTESGDLNQGLIFYKKAINLLPKKSSSLIKMAFVNNILAANIKDIKLLKLSLDYLLEAKKYEKLNPDLYLKLAKIYNKMMQEGDSYLALSHYKMLIEEKDDAKKYAKKAKEIYSKNNNKNGLIKVEDFLKIIEEN